MGRIHVESNPEWDTWRSRRRCVLDKRGNARHQRDKARTALRRARGIIDVWPSTKATYRDDNPGAIDAAKQHLELMEELAREAEQEYLCVQAMEPKEVPLKRTKRGNQYPCRCGMSKIRGSKWKNKNRRYWITRRGCKPSICMCRPSEQWIEFREPIVLWMTRYPVR